jgi:hypothetical protein
MLLLCFWIIYCLEDENDQIVNLAKTKVVVFRQGNYKYNKPVVYWGDRIIEAADNYVYLGVPFYGNMNVKQTTNDIIDKGIVAQNQHLSVFFKAHINNFDSRVKLFKSVVESIILYSSQTWAVSNLHKLQIFTNFSNKKAKSLIL